MSFEFISNIYLKLLSLKRRTDGRLSLLLAVSGGSDSVALLHIIYSLKKKLNLSIFVVTVNHNIRPKEESRGDAEFVRDLCSSFPEKIECLIIEIPNKKVAKIAYLRKKGIEDAARFLRYRAFEKAKNIFNADYVLTAHTKDDLYEGILMSLFKGASPFSLLGMKELRSYYFKPFLNVEKTTLISYLKKKSLLWHEDSTNYSFEFLRNKVRHILIPSLKKTFIGWKSGLQKTICRLSVDEEFINTSYNSFLKTIDYWKQSEYNYVYVNATSFFSMPNCFKIRFLQEGLIVLGFKHRVSYFSIISFIQSIEEGKEKSFNGISLSLKNDLLILRKFKEKKIKECDKKQGYMIWVKHAGVIEIENMKLYVEKRKRGIFICSSGDKEGIGPFNFPFCIRSRLFGDVIKVGKEIKTIKSIFSKWELSSHDKGILPIVEESGEIRAIYGIEMGKKNLIFS